MTISHQLTAYAVPPEQEGVARHEPSGFLVLTGQSLSQVRRRPFESRKMRHGIEDPFPRAAVRSGSRQVPEAAVLPVRHPCPTSVQEGFPRHSPSPGPPQLNTEPASSPTDKSPTPKASQKLTAPESRVQDMKMSLEEFLEPIVVAEGGGLEGQDGVGALGVVPELLAPLHPPVHLLDHRLHQ